MSVYKAQLTKEEWLELNGFSPDGITYLVLGNSYSCREKLKEIGFMYSPLLRWHGQTNTAELPEGCSYYEFRYEDFFTWDDEQKVSFMKTGTRDRIDLIFNPIEKTNSQFVGEIKERLRDLQVEVKNISGFDSEYGYKYVYTFRDADENLYTWFTTSQQPVHIGSKVILTGTVKAHVVYKGSKTTQLTRCLLSA